MNREKAGAAGGSKSPSTGKNSPGLDVPQLLDRIKALHPGIVFAASASMVTVAGCLFVLFAWLIAGPAKSAPSPAVAEATSTTKSAAGTTAPTSGGEPQAAAETPAAAKPVETPPDQIPLIRLKLHAITIGIHAYQDSFRLLPVLAGKQRGSQLSWRVHILPFLGQQELFAQFNLDEPWDGPTNSKLLAAMPDLYRFSPAEASTTRIQMFTGPDSLFAGRAAKLMDAKDGISATLLLIVVKPPYAQPWTKPDELTLAAGANAQVLGTVPDGQIEGVMCDGEFVSMPPDIAPEMLRGLITPAGKEIVDVARYRPKSGGVQSVGEIADLVNRAMGALGNAPGKNGGSDPAAGTIDYQGKLRKIGLAFHQFHDAAREFPVSTTLSWRVHLLPYLDQRPLYERFHLNEPWDSPHNSTLVQYMPDVFRTETAQQETTRFHVVVGEDTIFVAGRKPRMAVIQDGLSQTLLIVHAGADKASPWTKPDDPVYDPAHPMAFLGQLTSEPIYCCLADGNVLTLPPTLPAESFAALVTPRGREILDAQSLAGGTSPAAAASGPGTAPRANPNTVEMDRMKSIVLALHNYHDFNRSFPVAGNKDYFDKQGRPHLSWRVHILRYLDQEPLFKQFKLNEAWDSPNNKPLLDKMPTEYRDADDPPTSNTTRIVTIVGRQTLFEKPTAPSMRSMTDGTSQTIICLQVSDERAVPWTKPDDTTFDPGQPLAAIGSMPPVGVVAARADGAVFRIKPTISAQLFKAIVTPSGKEKLTRDDQAELGWP